MLLLSGQRVQRVGEKTSPKCMILGISGGYRGDGAITFSSKMDDIKGPGAGRKNLNDHDKNWKKKIGACMLT